MKSKADIQNEFGVSPATVNNWIKTGFIPSPLKDGNYTDSIFEGIRETMHHGLKLTGRANKKRNLKSTIGTDMLKNKSSWPALKKITSLPMAKDSLESIVFALGVRMLELKKLIAPSEYLVKCQQKSSEVFDNFLSSWMARVGQQQFKIAYDAICKITIPMDEIDFIGTVYQSLRTIGEKSNFGAYYTPDKILKDIKIQKDETVLDPCCGSGRILLNVLSESHDPHLIYANDIDPIALNICQINLALFFNTTKASSNFSLKNFIIQKPQLGDFLKTGAKKSFDVIITNPPWGAKSTPPERKIIQHEYNGIKTNESFSLVLYNSIKLLSATGRLYFILPESFLSVATHANIRKYIFNTTQKQQIRLYGNLFKGVLSKVISLELYKNHLAGGLSIINNTDLEVTIPHTFVSKKYFQIPVVANQIELTILKKVFSKKHTTLKDQCTFGLGLVTGENAKHLMYQANENTEPVYKGKEILPFLFKTPESHILFQQGTYQQMAPMSLYRQKKICYRFISNKIVMAVDTNNVLLLNSANFFIPNTPVSMEFIALLFNAPLTTFIFRRLFNATKVLKSHIESFPIPVVIDQDLKKGMELYNHAIQGREFNEDLNNFIGGLFNLTSEERIYIQKY
jgi:tRNA1(Val) A37 N6-methylase TrmN6